MIVNGWLDWAERMPAPWSKTNGGINPVKGIFLHSAEGYAPHLLDLAVSGPLSWHASNLMDGRLVQHYPFTARCWHATTANQEYVGIENEGVFTRETSLNEAQIANAVRLIKDLSAWKGWTPSRTGDATQTLWEHNEVTRIGGSATACPSGRIPWQKIMEELNAMPTDNDQILALLALAHFIRNGYNLADLSSGDKAAIAAAAGRVPQ